MKKNLLILTLPLLMCGFLLTACQSDSQKDQAAQDKQLQQTNDSLKQVVSADEWKMFRINAQTKIDNNEIRIAQLKEEIKKSGSRNLNEQYEKKIDQLEEQNKALKARIDGYDKRESTWESFKREFNHDMDGLVQSLKDFTVDNKN